jgi:Fe-S-cluster-containing dehydrogenase component
VAYVYVEGTSIVTAKIAVREESVRRWIAFDAQWCRTCRVCETACAIHHEGAARPALARIQVTFDEFVAELSAPVEEPAAAYDFVSATVCLQCADAPCIPACPAGALSRDARTGAVVVDADPDSERACIGCMLCRKACPWDVPRRHPERRVAIKCDLCAGREGGPVCVEMCPLSGKALRVERASAPEAAGHGCSVTPARVVEAVR